MLGATRKRSHWPVKGVEQPLFPRQCDGDRQLDVEAGSQNPTRPLRREGNRLEAPVEDRDPSPFQQLMYDRRELELPDVEQPQNGQRREEEQDEPA